MTSINLRVNKATYLNKMIGLIGKAQPEAIFFRTRFGIHTFGVRFPIDVMILNKNNEIVALREYLLPNRIFFWNPVFDTVLELPSGSIEKLKLRVGTQLEIIFN